MAQAVFKGLELFKGEYVLQALQRHCMVHLLKLAQRLPAHPLGGREGRSVLGVRPLQFLQPSKLAVVFIVLNLRLI